MMTLAALAALQADPESKALVIVSKPPAEVVARRVLAQVRASAKPTVVCFLEPIRARSKQRARSPPPI